MTDPTSPTPRMTALALALFAVLLTLFLGTLCPLPYGDYDAAELVACAADGGLPHPGGYPAWHATARLALRLTPLLPATTPSAVVNAVSAVFGAAASALLFLVLGELLRHRGVALAGALVLTTSLQYWRFSVVAEVYTLHLALALALILLALRWQTHRRPSTALLAAILAGVGLANHATFTFLLPALLVFFLLGRSLPGPRLALGLLLLGALPIALFYGLYLPRLASGPTPGPWATFFGLGQGMTASGVVEYATGRMYGGSMWSLDAVGEGLLGQADFLDAQLDALPLLPPSVGSLPGDLLLALLHRLLLVVTLAGLVCHARGQPASFALLAVWGGLTALFYAGQSPAAVPDLASMALPLLVPAAVWCAVGFKALVLLARDGLIPLRPPAVVLVALLLGLGRLAWTAPVADLSGWSVSSLYLDALRPRLSPGGALVTDWQTACLLRYDALVTPASPAADLAVLPFGVVTTSLRYRHGLTEAADIDRQWRTLLDGLLAAHRGRVDTTLLNVRAFAPFTATPVLMTPEAQLFRVGPPPLPRFASQEATGLTTEDVRFGDELRLAGLDVPRTGVPRGSVVELRLAWERLAPAPAPGGYRLLVRLVDLASGRPARLSSTEALPVLVWSLGRGFDLTGLWPAGKLLVEERVISLGPENSALALAPGPHALEVCLTTPAGPIESSRHGDEPAPWCRLATLDVR